MTTIDDIRAAFRQGGSLLPIVDLNPHLADLFLGPSMAAAVLVPLIDHPEGPGIVLTRRPSTLRLHAGQISFPGGRIDAGDADATQAALRETMEEIGVPPVKVEVIGTLPDCLTRTGFHVTPVVGLLKPPLVFRRNADEVEEILEAPLSALFDPVNGRIEAREGDGFAGRSYIFRYGAMEIWGATAAILASLRQLVEKAG